LIKMWDEKLKRKSQNKTAILKHMPQDKTFFLGFFYDV